MEESDFAGVGERRDKVVITSAHCLPHLPPAHGAAYSEEKTYGNLLGRLGETPTVRVECLFADPVSDIAVLGSLDYEGFGNDAYEELLEPIKPLAISGTKEKGRACLLSLERQWFPCTYEVWNAGPLWLSCKEEEIRGGVSGSPVLLGNGKAIGVVSLGSNTGESSNPRLMRNLPGWLLK